VQSVESIACDVAGHASAGLRVSDGYVVLATGFSYRKILGAMFDCVFGLLKVVTILNRPLNLF
jgi:hypothetical protein